MKTDLKMKDWNNLLNSTKKVVSEVTPRLSKD